MMQLFANLLDALTTNVTQLPTNVKLLYQAVMMVMLALLIASTQPLAVPTLLFALLLICAPQLLALLDNVPKLQRTAMTATHAPSTLVTLALELVSTLLSPALADPETSVLATLKPLSAKSDKHVSTTATVLLMEIQHILQSANQVLDAQTLLTQTIELIF